MLNDVLKHIEQRNRFVLTSHARPDGDAIGSALACRQILRAMGKKRTLFCAMACREFTSRCRLPRSCPGGDVNGDYEAAIILECDSIQRTRLQGLENKFLINIDHHLSGRPFAHVNWIDPKAVATAEMVYRLAREAGVKITPEIATCLYTAVLTDTGSFMFEGTNEHTFEWRASWCWRARTRHFARATFTLDIPRQRCDCWEPRFRTCIAKARWPGFP